MRWYSLMIPGILAGSLVLAGCRPEAPALDPAELDQLPASASAEPLPTAEVVVATQTAAPLPTAAPSPTPGPSLPSGLAQLTYRTVPQLEKLLSIPQPDVVDLEFSPDGRTLRMGLAPGEQAGTDIFWDLETGQEIFRLEGGGRVYFNPYGATIAALDQNSLSIYDLGSGERKAAYNSRNQIIGLSPDGKMIVEVVNVDPDLPGTSLRAVDITTEQEMYQLYVGGLVVEDSLQFDRDGDLMALTYTVPPDTKISTIWRAASGRTVRTLYGYSEIDLHPFGSEIAASSAKQRFISLISTVTWEQRIYLGPADDGPGYHDLAYAAEGRLLYALSGQDRAELSIWYPPSGETLPFDPGVEPQAITISPDRRLLAVSGADGQVAIWGVPE